MKRLFNNRPIVFSAITLVLGMIVATYFEKATYLFYIGCGLLVVAVLLGFFVKQLKPLKIEIVVLSIFFLLGFIYTRYNIFLFNNDEKFGGSDNYCVGIVEDLKIYDDYTLLTLSDVEIGGEKTFGNLQLQTTENLFSLGDKVKFYGKIYFNGFSVGTYSCKATLSANVDSVTLVSKPKSLFRVLSNYLKNNILKNVSGDEGGIMVALMLGDTSYVNSSTLSNYRLSGVSHIFAVSGLHVVFFASIISGFLSLVRLKGFPNTIVSTLCTIFYAGLCGFPVSAVRAVIMTATSNFVKNAGRKYDGLNSLFLSLIIVLAIFPHTLFTYGLILSYLAVSGIALYSKGCEKLFSFLPDSIASSIAVSFAVSIIMTPVLFKMWGYSSLIVVFLNIIIVPLVSVLYTLVFFTSLICAILPFCGFVFKIPYFVAYFINSVLIELNVKSFTLYARVTTISLVIYYVFALILCDRTNFKKPVKIISGILCFLTLILSIGGII